jgi:hypothetical protein
MIYSIRTYLVGGPMDGLKRGAEKKCGIERPTSSAQHCGRLLYLLQRKPLPEMPTNRNEEHQN